MNKSKYINKCSIHNKVPLIGISFSKYGAGIAINTNSLIDTISVTTNFLYKEGLLWINFSKIQYYYYY